MPAAKKDSSVRARRNKASTRRVLVAQPAGGSAPELPDASEWHPMTVAWWSDVWSSPMAGEYVTADQHGLFRLACLVEAFWRKPSTSLASEIRQQEQRFGLSPLDRRRLEWTIEQVDEARDRSRKRREGQGAKQPPRGKDPRSALSVVK